MILGVRSCLQEACRCSLELGRNRLQDLPGLLTMGAPPPQAHLHLTHPNGAQALLAGEPGLREALILLRNPF